MTIFQINKRRGHKFLMSGLMFGFCMARTLTMILVSFLIIPLWPQTNPFKAYCMGKLST